MAAAAGGAQPPPTKVRKQSAAAAAAEEAALRARIAVAERLRQGLAEPSSVLAQTVVAYQEVLDEVIMDIVLDVHRRVRTGQDDLSDLEQPAEPAGVFPPPGPANPWRGQKDVFGQSISATASAVITCTNCGKRLAASRFAPHLEKCMGVNERGGGTSSRPARAARARSPMIID
mmetsp:Transcript_11588/g.34796  ORF Transcript_11588/g.34796 Transcript_11588/m.34796 type:complete len:174 (-) Transcript_11588:3659-4180(-)